MALFWQQGGDWDGDTLLVGWGQWQDLEGQARCSFALVLAVLCEHLLVC